jgi:type IV pilus assembly protein PilM
MKHRQIGNPKVGIVNSDGHAIGLDIGATAVRASILSHGTLEGRPAVSIHGVAEMALPFGAVVNGVVNDPGSVSRALRQMWATNKFDCRNVIVGITSQQVVVRDLAMPNLPPDQLAKALPYQARDLVPLPLDQVLIDFAPLGEADPATEMQPGLLVATPREPVTAAVQAVERAGLQVARVDLSSFAVLRAIADEHLAIEAVIDIGAHLTNIVIHNQGVPKVVRTVPRGGTELTERLADRIGLELAHAEQVKQQEGLIGPSSAIVDALAEGIRPLMSEIRSSVHYFESTNGGSHLERISLTGGTSALPGLAEAMGEQLGIATGVIQPMQHIRNRWATKALREPDSEHSATAVSIGLAMGAAA